MIERNIFIKIAYDGSSYHGWQIQPNCNTIQETIQNSFLKITGEKIKLNASGRTDAGVHAKEQVATFKTSCSIPNNKIKDALNGDLPEDISIIASYGVGDLFHARYNAIGKTYFYRVYYGRELNPFLRNYSWHYPYKFSKKILDKSKDRLLGVHNFSAFQASGSSVIDTVREIYDIKIIDNEAEKFLDIYITGNGFLYNMVRIIVGTLFEIASGRMDDNIINRAFETCNRKILGKTAPAKGLYLKKVYYNKNVLNKFIKNLDIAVKNG